MKWSLWDPFNGNANIALFKIIQMTKHSSFIHVVDFNFRQYLSWHGKFNRVLSQTLTHIHQNNMSEMRLFLYLSSSHLSFAIIKVFPLAHQNVQIATQKKHTTLNIFNLSPLVHTHGARRECMKLSLIENSIVETFGSHVITYFVCIYLLFVHFIFYVWL